MRIVHFSDVHIGVENYGRPDPDTGLSTRLGDFLASLDEVVDYAIDEGADLALFCGDAYKSRDPSQTHQREFARRVARLSSAGVPVFLVLGNHDMPHVASRATALEIFHTLDVPNVYTGDRAGTQVVETRDGPLQIVTLPWIRRSGFLAREDMRGLTQDEVNDAIQRSLADTIRVQASQLDANVPAVFAGHVSVSEAEAGSEQSMMLGTDHVILKSNLSLPQLDYVALGHVHRHQVLGRNPLIVYSGSLQRVDFGEEKDDKGFCVIDLDPSQPAGRRVTDFEFHNVDARRFLTVEVVVRRGDPDPTATVVRAIRCKHVDDAIVRVSIRLQAEQDAYLRQEEIRQALEGAHFVASISRDVAEQPRNRLGNRSSDGLEPREALRLYLESKQVPSDRAKVLMRHAADLMQEPETS